MDVSRGQHEFDEQELHERALVKVLSEIDATSHYRRFKDNEIEYGTTIFVQKIEQAMHLAHEPLEEDDLYHIGGLIHLVLRGARPHLRVDPTRVLLGLQKRYWQFCLARSAGVILLDEELERLAVLSNVSLLQDKSDHSQLIGVHHIQESLALQCRLQMTTRAPMHPQIMNWIESLERRYKDLKEKFSTAHGTWRHMQEILMSVYKNEGILAKDLHGYSSAESFGKAHADFVAHGVARLEPMKTLIYRYANE